MASRKARRLLGAADIAAWFEVAPRTVAMWRRRGREYGMPFPEPDVEITTAIPGSYISGWAPEREDEIRAWKAAMPGQSWRAGLTGTETLTPAHTAAAAEGSRNGPAPAG